MAKKARSLAKRAASVLGLGKPKAPARAMSAIRAILEWDDDPVPLDPRHMAPADHNAPEWPDPDGHRYA